MEAVQIVDEVEQTFAIDTSKGFIWSRLWANVQPHSGSQANTAVFCRLFKAR